MKAQVENSLVVAPFIRHEPGFFVRQPSAPSGRRFVATGETAQPWNPWKAVRFFSSSPGGAQEADVAQT